MLRCLRIRIPGADGLRPPSQQPAVRGPPIYSERYGDETTVVRIHSGNGALIQVSALLLESGQGAPEVSHCLAVAIDLGAEDQHLKPVGTRTA